MKKIFAIFFGILFLSVPVFAGGLFYNSNQSAEYFRTYARNAATDNADIVYYNMSGTTQMKNGLYVNGSNQIIIQKATVKTENNSVVGDKTYTSDNPVWIVPNLYVLYKKDNWAAFMGFETIGATAIREWEDGLPSFDLNGITSSGAPYVSSYVKGQSEYLALRVGGAYAVNQMISVALCGRVVYSEQNSEGYIKAGASASTATKIVELDYTDKAKGVSGEMNMNLYPAKGMVIGFTYEMATRLNFERNVNDGKNGGGSVVDGSKARLDLPQVLRLGFSYNITDSLRTEIGLNAYLEKYANMDALDNQTAGIDSESDYGNTYEEGLCFEYTFSKLFLASIGFNLNQIGQKKSATLDTSTPGGHNNYYSIGIGGQLSPVEDLKINLSLGYTSFIKKYSHADYTDTGTANKEYNKRYLNIGLGAEYRFM